MEYVMREDSIDLLNFSTRVSNRLKSMKMMTIGDYLNYPEDSWITIKNLGKKSVDELLETKKQLLQGRHPFLVLADGEPAAGKVTEPLIGEASSEPKSRRTFIADNGETYYDILIDELPFSVRSRNCLKRGGYVYASELLHITDEELKAIRHSGVSTVSDIRAVMNNVPWQTAADIAEEDKPNPNDIAVADDISEKLQISRGELIRRMKAIRKENPAIAGESLIYLLFETELVVTGLRNTVLYLLGESNEPVSIYNLEEKLPGSIRNTTILEEQLLLMERKKEVTYNGVQVSRRYPSILDYISGLTNVKIRDMLSRKIAGETLEAIGSTWGLTRERVRQIINKGIRKRPRVEEDRYLPIYSKYDFSQEDFVRIFDSDNTTYNYLELVCTVPNKDKKPMEDILTDETVSPEVRRACEVADNKNKLYLGGVYVPKNRESIIKYVVKAYCTDATKAAHILEYYNHVLEELGLTGDPQLETGLAYLSNRLADPKFDTLSCGSHSFRYYNVASRDYDNFFRDIKLSEYRDVELSTLKIFRDYPETMQEYDIRDEYELHNLLRKLYDGIDDADITFGKMPTITIGTADRDMQLLDLLIETAPINKWDFAKAYEELYGAKAATVMGSYVKCLEDYLVGDTYRINYDPMPLDQVAKMKEMLDQPIYRIADIERLYYRTYPEAPRQMVNAYTLRQMGFEPQSNYAYRNCYKNAADCFRHMLLDEDIVDETEFPRCVHTIGAYTSTQMGLRLSRDITDYQPGKFINIRRLEQIGVTKETLETYCAAVSRAVPRGGLFTIESLRSSGFEHPLDDLGFEPWFYSSVLAADKERFSIRRLGSTRIICSGIRDVQLSDLIVSIVERERQYEIHDLNEYLSDYYGIVIPLEKLKSVIGGTDLYYDKIMETVYVDYDTYFEEV